jgi:hypothetical protein
MNNSQDTPGLATTTRHGNGTRQQQHLQPLLKLWHCSGSAETNNHQEKRKPAAAQA